MKITNWIIFIGFIISGAAFFTAMALGNFVAEEHWLRNNVLPFLIGVGVLLGWFFTVAGLVNMMFGIAFKISGRLQRFWKSLYPINFCFSILAMLIISYG